MQYTWDLCPAPKALLLLAFVSLLQLNTSLAASIEQVQKRWDVTSGAVSSEDKTCSQIGIDLMKAGGNAADAVSLALTTVIRGDINSRFHRPLGQCFVLEPKVCDFCSAVYLTYVLTMADMYHSGIGGGGFALVRGTNGSYVMVDFREIAPKAATQNMYDGNYNGSLIGGLSRSVNMTTE